ncbi:hypothetical protein WJX77_008125 [Trebouxia sp. C0004]
MPSGERATRGTTCHSKDPGQARQLRSTLKAITSVPEYRYPTTTPNTTARSQPEDNTRACQHQEPCQGTEHRAKRPRPTAKTGANSKTPGQQTDTIQMGEYQLHRDQAIQHRSTDCSLPCSHTHTTYQSLHTMSAQGHCPTQHKPTSDIVHTGYQRLLACPTCLALVLSCSAAHAQ